MNAQDHPEIRIDRNENGGAINAQIISLLHLVDETGSIPEACDLARIDLLPAWNMLAQAEDALGFPLFQYIQHKSYLTEKARKLMDAYDQFPQQMCITDSVGCQKIIVKSSCVHR